MSSNTTTRRAAVLSLLAAFVLVAACACGARGEGGEASGQQAQPQQQSGADITSVEPDDPFATGIHHVAIEVEGHGTIEATLNANVAPITVSNFCHLAKDGFYDGLTFHRIIDGFMVQGGDPNGDGTGGAERTIKGEFSANGVKNDIPHVRGTISMARANDPDSGSSQFFIMQADNANLNGNYAAFGTVTSGMDVVDALCKEVPVEDGNGTVAPENQPRIAHVEVID